MEISNLKREIPDRLFFRIGDVAELLEVKPYVLRYWETEFPFLSPNKSQSGQRIYRKMDVETLALIKQLLYHERYSIEGARKKIRELKREGDLTSAKKEAARNTGPKVTSELCGELHKELDALIEITKRSFIFAPKN